MKLPTAFLYLAALSIAPSALAQDQPVPVPVPPPGQQQQGQQQQGQPPRPQSRRVVLPQSPESPAAAEFEKNVTVRVQGSLFGAMPVDLSLLAGGPSLNSSLPILGGSSGPATVNVTATLTPGSPWKIALSLGSQVPITTAPGQIEYREFRLNTNVKVEAGKKVVLWQQGEEKLTLSLEEAKE